MTKPEYTFNRDNFFSGWVRKNLPKSADGLVISDVDMILSNYKQRKIMLLEIKLRSKDIEQWQRQLFNKIHQWIKDGIKIDKDGWQYRGFYKLQFENTDFQNGKAYFGNRTQIKEINEYKLIEKICFLLSFKTPIKKYTV